MGFRASPQKRCAGTAFHADPLFKPSAGGQEIIFKDSISPSGNSGNIRKVETTSHLSRRPHFSTTSPPFRVRKKKKRWGRQSTSPPCGDVPTFSVVKKGGDVATVSFPASLRFHEQDWDFGILISNMVGDDSGNLNRTP